MRTEDVNLRHDLTDSEMAKLAKAQANAIEKKSAAEAELGAIKKDYAGRIALADAEVSTISQRVNSGWEMRNVHCILADERIAGYRLTVRTDTGHVAKRRKLEPEERQMKITDMAPPPYAAFALLQVDDLDWHDADMVQVPFFGDEVDLLRNVIPPIKFMPMNTAATLALESGDQPTTNKKRGKKK